MIEKLAMRECVIKLQREGIDGAYVLIANHANTFGIVVLHLFAYCEQFTI